ncbi:unnamed protein product [Protopolystoma xenopodis]|uniref:Alkyl hydroperoxide reductase subunit C/ Thiol specific antioxidant domain-containing protein n=1 Tax=Protopolystoma xenopodis TaxID=117903 RepID=A0A448WWH2_9PLAT|nr:unnamed protein product [Protopolystoma xenopodis]
MLNCTIWAISTDSYESHRAWYDAPTSRLGFDKNLHFALCQDKNTVISRLFGVLNEQDGTAYRWVIN